jgi:hypothetical protein
MDLVYTAAHISLRTQLNVICTFNQTILHQKTGRRVKATQVPLDSLQGHERESVIWNLVSDHNSVFE